MDKQMDRLDKKIDREGVELKKREIYKHIQDKLAEAKRRNLQASLLTVTSVDAQAFKVMSDKLNIDEYN
jgi:hypothetical protein